MARGGIQKPIRYATTVEGPLRVSGQINRTRECADHHIILSTSPTPPAQAGGVLFPPRHHACMPNLQAWHPPIT